MKALSVLMKLSFPLTKQLATLLKMNTFTVLYKGFSEYLGAPVKAHL